MCVIETLATSERSRLALGLAGGGTLRDWLLGLAFGLRPEIGGEGDAFDCELFVFEPGEEN